LPAAELPEADPLAGPAIDLPAMNVGVKVAFPMTDVPVGE